jgi:hypothetical protein
VRSSFVQVAHVIALGVQRVGGHHDIGEPVDGVEQRGERGNLAGLGVDPDLAEHDASVVVDHRQQVLLSVSGACAPQGLPVDRDHPATSGRRAGGRQLLDPGADRGVEPVAVEPLHHPADRGLTRTPPTQPERGRGMVGQVGDPFGDRNVGLGAGGDGADRRAEHDDQWVAHAATGSRVDHRRQDFTQPWGNRDRIGQAEVDQVISGSTDRG